MKRAMLAAALAAVVLFVAACGPNASAVKNAQPIEKAGAPQIPPAPAEGMDLAKAAERVPISNGPSTPVRKVLSQEPEQRPCWAAPEGGCPPPPKPGCHAYVGVSSGAFDSAGAVLNAYQNALETLAAQCARQSGDPSPQAREKARAMAYFKSGVYDKSNKWQEGYWFQKWEERFKDSMRVYYRAFVLVYVPDELFNQMIP